ncbi:glycosyltransferase family 4 protein [Halorubrum halophilum]|uniref:glycosyltransferase family 4 protein n=1 Tax=Halorubrum halophilum TaxID=413816 RepID=UPI0009E4D953|nr:glycosyltransferase family 4 protein [Halorubrum halophilum]
MEEGLKEQENNLKLIGMPPENRDPPKNSKLDITFVSPRLYYYLKPGGDQGAGGAERQQFLLSQELVDRGHNVSAITRIFDSIEKSNSRDVTMYQLIPDTNSILLFPFKFLWLAMVFTWINSDVYYVRGHPNLCFVVGLFCRIRGAGFVYVVANDRDIEPDKIGSHGKIFKYLYIWSIRGADQVVTLTDYQKEILRKEYGIDANTIPCGYDLPPEKNILSHREREYFLWVGRFDPDQKNPAKFVDAAEKLPNINFVMVGPPIEGEEEFYQEIKDRALSVPNISFEGFIEPDQIDSYYRSAKALVNTSDSEGFGNVFLEAWRYETPVISLEYSLHGTISEEDIGIYAGDFDTLLKSIQQLDSDVEHRQRLGAEGRKFLLENYSLEVVADQTEQILREAQWDRKYE